jgi:hypothetical protein
MFDTETLVPPGWADHPSKVGVATQVYVAAPLQVFDVPTETPDVGAAAPAPLKLNRRK